jgi:hypothetical protein
MKFSVIQLREKGVRLGRDAIAAAEPLRGQLVIDDFVEGNNEKRPLRQANIYEQLSSCRRGILPPLFEPQIIRMTDRWFLLNGWQIEVEGKACVHYRQEWLVRQE